MGKDFTAGNVAGTTNCVREAVCIHTDKVYDSCRDKECIEDLRVYFPVCHQELIDNAMNVKLNNVEILWVQTDVEPLSFNQVYYTVDIRFFFKVSVDVYCDMLRPKRIEGLAVYDKKVVLFGSEGKARIFQSLYQYQAADQQMAVKNNLPKAVVEVLILCLLMQNLLKDVRTTVAISLIFLQHLILSATVLKMFFLHRIHQNVFISQSVFSLLLSLREAFSFLFLFTTSVYLQKSAFLQLQRTHVNCSSLLTSPLTNSILLLTVMIPADADVDVTDEKPSIARFFLLTI